MAHDTAAIALIGDELLSGKVEDENARLMVKELRELGVALRKLVMIPDVVSEIAATVRALSDTHTHVFTSGGVGPTHDDLTMDGVARAFELRVVRHPLLEQMLRGHYGDKLEERDLRMADVPEGCELVAGEGPAWPTVAVKNVYILPGVPQIFRRKWATIRERFRQAPFFLRGVYTSLEEGAIAHHLDAIVAAYPDVQVGSYPRLDEPSYRVKLTLESKEEASVARATTDLIARLGGAVVRTEP